MAIDAGTGNRRAIIFNTRGKEVGSAQREWTSRNTREEVHHWRREARRLVRRASPVQSNTKKGTDNGRPG